MFGYVRYDLPNLYVKDVMLYRAIYCGVCKGIAKSCGQTARLGLTYDIAFLSALLHNIAGIDIKVTKQNCFEHAIRKRPIAEVDPLTEELGALNTALVYYKFTDDIRDGEHGRVKRLGFGKGFKRAKKKYPALVSAVKEGLAEQEEVERKETASPDAAAEPTASMMRSLSRILLKEKATEATDELFYSLGKWVYLVDALDDYDKDKKKKKYNPFVLSYRKNSREELMKECGGEIEFLFDTLFYAMREALAGIGFSFNRDLTDNIILRGIPIETELVMRGEHKNKKADGVRI